VISSHLGDAYWFAHRRTEARFQWQHALGMKDDSDEITQEELQAKLENGLAQEPALTYDKDKIEEFIKQIKKPSSVRRVVIRR